MFLNKLTLMGKLGGEPQALTLQSGARKVSFRVVTRRSWKDQAGAWVEREQWHQVVIWNEKLGDKGLKLRKGSTVYLEGELESRKYTKDGKETEVYEVILHRFSGELMNLTKPSQSGDEPGQECSPEAERPQQRQRSSYSDSNLDADADIPF